MTTRRRLLLFALLGGLLALGIFAVLWPRSAINRTNAAKIHKGMTLEEVETILGGPARNEASGPVATDPTEDEPEESLVWNYSIDGDWFFAREWRSDYVVIRVAHQDGEVRTCQVMPVHPTTESPWRILRRRLRL